MTTVVLSRHARQRVGERLRGDEAWVLAEAGAAWQGGHVARKPPRWAGNCTTFAVADDARWVRATHPDGDECVILVAPDGSRLVVVTVVTRSNTTARKGTSTERRTRRHNTRMWERRAL